MSTKVELYFKDKKGENNPRHELTEEQAREIKKELKNPRHGLYASLARAYGVSRSCIQTIKDGRNWKHVDV